MRIVVLAVLLTGAALAVEPTVFRSYLLTVAQSKDAPAGVVSIAQDFVARTAALNGANLVFDARLRAIESPGEADAIAAALAADLKQLESRRAELLADALQRARTALGETDFAAFERTVDAWHTAQLNRPRPTARKQ